MSEEPLDKKSVRRNRLWLLFWLLVIAGGIVWAIRSESDVVAAITCLVTGIAFGVTGDDSGNPFNGAGKGIVVGVGLF